MPWSMQKALNLNMNGLKISKEIFFRVKSGSEVEPPAFKQSDPILGTVLRALKMFLVRLS
jgi:hypothetical protein